MIQTPSKIMKPEHIINADWMPDVAMQRIIGHWTAGNHHPSAEDLQHYHIVIDGEGGLHRGKFSIAANAPLRLREGTYAAHTFNCNSRSIGVSLACMAEAVERPFDSGRAPLQKIQWLRLIEVMAALACRYDIPVTPQTILTHAEVQSNLAIRQKQKWDISRLPFDTTIVGAQAVGDKLRAEVAVILKAMRK